MQIRTQLTLRFLFIVAGILLLSVMFIYLKFKHYTEDEFYASLRSKAYMTAEMLVKDEQSASRLSAAAEAPLPKAAEATPYREYVQIYDHSGKRLYTLSSQADKVNAQTLRLIEEKGEWRFNSSGLPALGVRYVNWNGATFYIVTAAVFEAKSLVSLRNILIFDFLLIIAIVALGGWIFAGQALAPVSRIMNQVDEILPSDLGKRLEVNHKKDELSRLVITFNKMLDRMQDAFMMQKSFISNISHELKNPLTIIISQLEVALHKERSSGEYQKVMHSVLEDAKEMTEVADKLMQLAKVNAETASISFSSLRLDELIWQSREGLLKSHPNYRVALDFGNLPEDETQLLIRGNESLLRTAFVNLMDNGCKFSPDKTVAIRMSLAEGQNHIIEIADKGPGIQEMERKQIFEPFYRSPHTAHIKGSGVGLSLVNSILKMHGIRYEILTTKDCGTTFRLQIQSELETKKEQKLAHNLLEAVVTT